MRREIWDVSKQSTPCVKGIYIQKGVPKTLVETKHIFVGGGGFCFSFLWLLLVRDRKDKFGG